MEQPSRSIPMQKFARLTVFSENCAPAFPAACQQMQRVNDLTASVLIGIQLAH
jgi:hypothetical protein